MIRLPPPSPLFPYTTLFRSPTSTAEHAMIARTRVDTVRADESVDAVLSRMATGHTRYPVVGDSTDDLLGVLDLHEDRKSTRLNSSHMSISYAVFCLKKKRQD